MSEPLVIVDQLRAAAAFPPVDGSWLGVAAVAITSRRPPTALVAEPQQRQRAARPAPVSASDLEKAPGEPNGR